MYNAHYSPTNRCFSTPPFTVDDVCSFTTVYRHRWMRLSMRSGTPPHSGILDKYYPSKTTSTTFTSWMGIRRIFLFQKRNFARFLPVRRRTLTSGRRFTTPETRNLVGERQQTSMTVSLLFSVVNLVKPHPTGVNGSPTFV